MRGEASTIREVGCSISKQKHKDHIEIEPCEMFQQGAIVIAACGHLLESYSPADYKRMVTGYSTYCAKGFKIQIKNY